MSEREPHDHEPGRGGHGHSHDHQAVVPDSTEGWRALIISLVVLAITAMVQAFIVAFSGSVALLADTVHNVADAATSIPLAIAFWFGRRPPSRRFTYGYGRAEDLAGIVIVAVIAASAAYAAWEAIHRLGDPRAITHVGWVITAGVVGFIGNEAVAVYRIRVGRKIGSAALVADGLHARTDGLTSLGVVAGGIGSALGYPIADALAGLVIAAMILTVLRQAVRAVGRRLLDAVEPGLVDQVEHVLSHVDGIEGVEELRLRWVGQHLRAEICIEVDGRRSLRDAHGIAEEARHQLLHELDRLEDAVIHTSPAGDGGGDPHRETAHHREKPGKAAGAAS